MKSEAGQNGNKQGPAEKNGPVAKGNSPQSPDLKTKLADETHLRRFTENVLDSRQQEIENRESEKGKLSAKVEALEKKLASAQKQLSESRRETKTKAKQLQDAQEHIFRLQPDRKDITETEAREAYKNLVGNVQRWVENRVKDILEDLESGRLKSRTVPPEASRFVALLREQSRRCLNADQSDEYHIMGAIMNYLYLALFSKSFYCPLDDTEEDGTLMWLDELQSTMSRLPRDEAQCREWRSETLTALTHQPIFKTRRSRYLHMVTNDLTTVLSAIAPMTPPAELHSSIRRSIVEPAADLVHQLHLASSSFSLKWPARTAASRLEVYQCLNLASNGMILDLGGTKQTSASRRNVSYLFDVAPGLFVERLEDGKKQGVKAIVKPTVLVDNAEGEPKRGKRAREK
ncbi:hypothetical protein N0V84_004545 [Fusarium piperis]|uniref:Uncharacterized protein n=1 Tax=Fusarium piperis TaxID=1435070 RepID=A0A9W8WFE5_9HYPO|nr:hypothetical protein N0V84_004545 [Fusarium piperis]